MGNSINSNLNNNIVATNFINFPLPGGSTTTIEPTTTSSTTSAPTTTSSTTTSAPTTTSSTTTSAPTTTSTTTSAPTSICLDYLGNGSAYTFELQEYGWSGFNAYSGTIGGVVRYLWVYMFTVNTTKWYLTNTLGSGSTIDETSGTESVYTTSDPPVGLTFSNGTTITLGACSGTTIAPTTTPAPTTTSSTTTSAPTTTSSTTTSAPTTTSSTTTSAPTTTTSTTTPPP